MALVNKPLIKETSITTGTGSYALLGAVTDYLAFSTLGTPSSTLYTRYFAHMNPDWEEGYGTLSATGTLERTAVIRSSNANAAVNWGVGTKVIYCAVGADQPPKNNIGNNPGFPGTGNNYTQGYSAGSVWESGGQVWVCINPGTPALSTAVWARIADPSRLGRVDTITDNGYACYSIGGTTSAEAGVSDINNAVGVGDGGEINFSNSLVRGIGWDPTQNDPGGHQHTSVGGVLKTTNATPTVIYTGDDSRPMKVPTDCLWRGKGTVVAYNATDNVASSWDIAFTVKRQASGNPTFVGSADVTMAEQDGGAAAWGVALTINNTDKSVETTVTGEAAKTIYWTVDYDITQVAKR